MKKSLIVIFDLSWIVTETCKADTEKGTTPIAALREELSKKVTGASIEEITVKKLRIVWEDENFSRDQIKELVFDVIRERFSPEKLGSLMKFEEEEEAPKNTDQTLFTELAATEQAAQATTETAERNDEGEEPSAEPKIQINEDAFAYLNDIVRRQKGESVPPPPKSNATLAEVYGKIAEMRKKLGEKIFGQQHAINAFTEGLFGVRVFSDRQDGRKGPKGVFLFAGPPGVGKTYLAETAAEILNLPFLRVDMSEYSSEHASEEFNGTDAVYRGSKPGRVTGFVDSHPECVLLFDEVEKAHATTIQLFLQILEGARLNDVCMNKEIDFSHTIIIMTTNAGRNLYEDATKINLSGIPAKTVISALKSDINSLTGEPFFPAPIVSRVAAGTVVMFNHLEPFALRDIVSRELQSRFELVEKEFHIKIGVDFNELSSAILYSEGGAADARTLKGAADNFVRRELLSLFNQFRGDNYEKDFEKLKEIHFTVDLEGASEEASKLFQGGKGKSVLIFTEEGNTKRLPRETEEFKLVFSHDYKEAQELLRGDLACALIDFTCNTHEGSFMPSDLEDTDSDGSRLFRYAREFEQELPLYALNTTQEEPDRFLSVINSGARDVVPLNAQEEEKFLSRVGELTQNAAMADGAYRLARANKILTYNAVQLFHENGTRAEICLTALGLKRAVRAEDRNSILDATSRPDVGFADVIGLKDAKESLAEFIGYLKNPVEYLSRGVRAPRGVLLYGPPGTGKTFLAKATAGESDVAFIQKNATEFFQMYVGEGPRMIRELFATARRYAPAIIFIDEVDAFARIRTGNDSGQFAAELLNTFLSELDGFVFDEKRPVFVLAATNYEIDVSEGGGRTLDPAFVRRFDRKIRIELPNTEDRELLLRHYLDRHGIKDISDESVRSVAKRSFGKSPADLEMVVEYAIRRAKGKKLTDDIFEQSLDADTYGEERNWRESTVRQITYHEAGHTVISWLSGKKPTYVTNISRGGFGGYMMPEVDDKKFGYSRKELLDEICCSLGGRAAETVFFGEEGISTGASSDLKNATETARRMICTYGMDDSFVSYEPNAFGLDVETRLFEKIDGILKQEYNRAVKLLTENKDAVESLVNELLKKNSLTAEEIEATLSPYKK